MISKERMIELTRALRDAELLGWRGAKNQHGAWCVGMKGDCIAFAARHGVDCFEAGDPVLMGMYIDLNDDGTVGVLKGQARELWGDPDMYCRALSLGGRWTVCLFDRSGMPHVFTAMTEAEVWVDAILHAPRETGR